MKKYAVFQQDRQISEPMSREDAEATKKRLESCLTNLWIDEVEGKE